MTSATISRPAARATLLSPRRQGRPARRRGRDFLVATLLLLAASGAAAAPAPPPAPAATPAGAAAAADDTAARRVIAREELGIDTRVGYSGDRIVESSQAGRTLKVREFRMPGKARLEFEEQGQAVVMILDETAGSAFMLTPALRMYTTLSVREFQERAWDSLDLLDFERLDRERVNGYDATRYRVSYRDADGNQGHGFHWVTDDGVAIRLDVTYDSAERSGDRLLLDLHNLVVAPQEPTLFELPQDYVPLPSLEGLLGTQSGGSDGIDVEAIREGLGDLLNN